ncbi:MAG TPA: glycine cleavage system aminomethyltransferase GcvT [Streptosporangiaceae bacterium]|nr:glycine cleavage system aminomethyltransferase GcvT [Streptosporangiaceae bacterium]
MPAAQPPVKHTPLYEIHRELGATLVEFAGYLMPLRYGSETAEHQAVRTAAGLFDLSHMGEIFVTGPRAAAALDYALVGHISALRVGRARYTMICDPAGGVLDDLIVYRLAPETFMIVANAANAATVTAELTERARPEAPGAVVTDRSDSYALIAVQGPNAQRILAKHTDAPLAELSYYAIMAHRVAGIDVLIARTGYTGEDGFELFVSAGDAPRLWRELAASPEPPVPAGLSARDTLRLEAGMPLYGNELTAETTPYDAGLGRVVKLDKPGDFVGRAALAARADTPDGRTLVGLVARGRRVPRHGYDVVAMAEKDGTPCGVVTSGAPSPTLGKPIAMAYLNAETEPVDLAVDIRGRREPVDVVPLPFYRRSSQ